MRLRRLDLLRYGHFTNKSIELKPKATDFHIVFGPNEAGKSTALAALEDLLFGIPLHSSYGFLHDYSNMRIGAILENGKTSLKIIRRKGNKDTLVDEDGLSLPEGEEKLTLLLGGADRSFFERMFSLDHSRLEEGGKAILEAKDEMGQMLFSAAAGIGGLRGRLEHLSNEADILWGERRSTRRRYSQADDRLKKAEKELREQTLSASEWDKLKKAFDRATKDYEGVQTQFEEKFAQKEKVSRIRRVYPLLRGKSELEAEIGNLGDVVALPDDTRGKLDEAEQAASLATANINRVCGKIKETRQALETLSYDQELLARQDDVNQLYERGIQVSAAMADLPALQSELDASRKVLAQLGRDLEWHEDDESKLIARLPARNKIGAARALLGTYGKLKSDVESKTDLLQTISAKLSKLHKNLSNLGEPADISRIAAVIKDVKSAADVTSRISSSDKELKKLQRQVDHCLSSLNPHVQSEKDIVELRVPSRPEVVKHGEKVEALEGRLKEKLQKIDLAQEELSKAIEKQHSMLGKATTVSLAALQEKRSYRDAIWDLVKRQHIQPAPISEIESAKYADELKDLSSAFEPAMQKADQAADFRFDHAEESGRLAELERTVHEKEELIERVRKEEEALIKESERLSADWQRIWNTVPFEPRSPEVMLNWLDERDELVSLLGSRQEAALELQSHVTEEKEARNRIRNELSKIGADQPEMSSMRLSELLIRASDVEAEHRDLTKRKEQLVEDLGDSEAEQANQKQTQELAREALSTWKEKWEQVIRELGVVQSLEPETAETQIEIIEAMRRKADQIFKLKHERIASMEKAISEFENAVGGMITEVAQDLSRVPATEGARELKGRLEKALKVRDLQDGKQNELKGLEKELQVEQKKFQDANNVMSYLQKSANAGDVDALKHAIEKSVKHRNLTSLLEQARKNLDEAGDGLAIDLLQQECAAVDIDRIAAQEETIGRDIKGLKEQLTEATKIRGEAEQDLKRVGGEDAAARAEAERQEAISEIRDVAGRYVRVRPAVMLLQWAIDRYRREKQAPLLKRAGELFSTITRESFSALRIEYDDHDRPQLAGLRPDKKIVPVTGMSSGSADQLYLALRVASIEDYLRRASALPFIADDLFINFDDDRAAAGLKVLASLAEKTQVLFFSHHKHLVDIARSVLGASVKVVNLDEIPKS